VVRHLLRALGRLVGARSLSCSAGLLVAGVAVVPAAGGGALAPFEGYRPAAQLTVFIRDLRAPLEAAVTVTGPDGYEASVSRTETLSDLRSGRYTVEAGPVREGGGTAWPFQADGDKPPWRNTINLVGTAPRSMTVYYADFVSSLTRVVPDDATTSLVAGLGGKEVLSVSPALAGQRYRRGEFLVSQPSPRDLDGYVLTVDDVEPGSRGGAEVLDTTPVDIDKAVPEGEIDARRVLNVESPDFEFTSLHCSTKATLDVAAQFRVVPTLSFRLQWRFPKLRAAEMSVGITEEATAAATASGRARCESSSTERVWSSRSILPHGYFTVFVGPVPVVIRPTLDLYLSGQASMEGSVNVRVEQHAKLEGRLVYPKAEQLSEPSNAWTRSSFTSKASVSADVSVTPTLGLLLYGHVGPSLGVQAQLKFEATPQDHTLQGCLGLTGHIEIPRLGLRKGPPYLLAPRCETLVSRRHG